MEVLNFIRDVAAWSGWLAIAGLGYLLISGVLLIKARARAGAVGRAMLVGGIWASLTSLTILFYLGWVMMAGPSGPLAYAPVIMAVLSGWFVVNAVQAPEPQTGQALVMCFEMLTVAVVLSGWSKADDAHYPTLYAAFGAVAFLIALWDVARVVIHDRRRRRNLARKMAKS